MKRLPPLHLLFAFEAIARHQSLTQAARELHVTASAVSHRLANLQALLKVRLFFKTHEGISLTPDGQRYSLAVGDLLQHMKTFSACLDVDASEQRAVRLRSGPSFAELWLLPRLPDFRAKHPEISIQFESSTKPVDFRREAIDLWLMRGRPSDDTLVTEPLMAEHFMPLASPGYLARHTLKNLADISTQAAIYCARCSPNWADWFKRYCSVDHQMDWGLAFSHASHALQAATQGLGVVLESLEIANPFLKDGRLVPVFSDHAVIKTAGHALIYPEAHLERPAVAIFRAWLGTALKASGVAIATEYQE